jgi:hypothetical protein
MSLTRGSGSAATELSLNKTKRADTVGQNRRVDDRPQVYEQAHYAALKPEMQPT